MKKATLLCVLAAMALAMGLIGSAAAGNSCSVSIVIEVKEINVIKVNGPISLIVSDDLAGGESVVATDTATYDITTNGTNKTITGRVKRGILPAGASLSVNLEAPTSSGSSKGYVELTKTDAELVTGITCVAQKALNMTFKLLASASAEIVAPADEVVVLTIVDAD